jgi:hypothetical protein
LPRNASVPCAWTRWASEPLGDVLAPRRQDRTIGGAGELHAGRRDRRQRVQQIELRAALLREVRRGAQGFVRVRAPSATHTSRRLSAKTESLAFMVGSFRPARALRRVARARARLCRASAR